MSPIDSRPSARVLRTPGTFHHDATFVAHTESRTMQGTVKFFDDQRGFGFITSDGGEDLFVHHSNIDGTGYKSLTEGQAVEFEVGPGRKGQEARNVRTR